MESTVQSLSVFHFGLGRDSERLQAPRQINNSARDATTATMAAARQRGPSDVLQSGCVGSMDVDKKTNQTTHAVKKKTKTKNL